MCFTVREQIGVPLGSVCNPSPLPGLVLGSARSLLAKMALKASHPTKSGCPCLCFEYQLDEQLSQVLLRGQAEEARRIRDHRKHFWVLIRSFPETGHGRVVRGLRAVPQARGSREAATNPRRPSPGRAEPLGAVWCTFLLWSSPPSPTEGGNGLDGFFCKYLS